MIIEVEALHKMFSHGEESQTHQGACLRCGRDTKVKISRTSGGYGFQGGVLIHQEFFILCADCFKESNANNVPIDSPRYNDASKMERPLRVIVADDHREMRKALIQLLDCQKGIQVVGEAANGREALELSRQLRPDVVVMDFSMPVMNGVEATRRIKGEMPKVRVIGLSMYEDELVGRIMRHAGAEFYFMSKAGSLAGLPDAIHGQGFGSNIDQSSNVSSEIATDINRVKQMAADMSDNSSQVSGLADELKQL